MFDFLIVLTNTNAMLCEVILTLLALNIPRT